MTLDDQVQLALAIVLDRLTPPERTAFVLHDVFGLPFEAVGEVVGRTAGACRQLASRARKSIRSGDQVPHSSDTLDDPVTRPSVVTERFIAACEGGDISELMALLDPEIVGDAILLGHGPVRHAEGRASVAQRAFGFFGPLSDTRLVPIAFEGEPGVVAFSHGRLAALMRLDEQDGLITAIHAYIVPQRIIPRRASHATRHSERMTAPDTPAADDVERFVTDGFVRVEHAFDRELARAGCELLYADIRVQHAGFDPAVAATWPAPTVRLLGSNEEPFRAAVNSARLTSAFDALVGPARWVPRRGLGTFPIRFAHEQEPDDDGWHIDGSFTGPDGTYWANIHSRDRALLMLFLFTDIGPDDAPTRIRVGSHLRVARLLAAAGDAGVPSAPVAAAVPDLDALPLAFATGRAGDVYLCHPFLVHAGNRHLGSSPHVIAQPELSPVGGQLDIDGPDKHLSAVERAIRRGLRGSPQY